MVGKCNGFYCANAFMYAMCCTFVLTGGVVIYLSSHALQDENLQSYPKFFQPEEDAVKPTVAILLVVVGSSLIPLSLFGLWARATGRVRLLLVFSVLLGIVCSLQFAAAIIGYIQSDKIPDINAVELRSDYIENYFSNDGNKLAVDNLQQHLNCCGSHDYTDWFEVTQLNPNPEQVVSPCCNTNLYVSCTSDELNRDTILKYCFPEDSSSASSSCKVFTRGCEEQVKYAVKTKIFGLAEMATGLGIMHFLGIIPAICLIYLIRKDDMDSSTRQDLPATDVVCCAVFLGACRQIR